jgi:hypothetical protein
MKIAIRCLLAALLVSAAACAAPTAPSATANSAEASRDGVPSDTTNSNGRGPNTFGSGN